MPYVKCLLIDRFFSFFFSLLFDEKFLLLYEMRCQIWNKLNYQKKPVFVRGLLEWTLIWSHISRCRLLWRIAEKVILKNYFFIHFIWKSLIKNASREFQTFISFSCYLISHHKAGIRDFFCLGYFYWRHCYSTFFFVAVVVLDGRKYREITLDLDFFCTIFMCCPDLFSFWDTFFCQGFLFK